MITTLRKHTKLIFWLIIILIVPAFVFWGTSTVKHAQYKRHAELFGKIDGKRIGLGEWQNSVYYEMQKLNYFILHIIREKRYRRPLHDYWQALRNVMIQRDLHWSGQNPPDSYFVRRDPNNPYSTALEYFLPMYILQKNQYVMLRIPELGEWREMMHISDEAIDRYIKEVMFPSSDGELDIKARNEYMARYGLDEKQLQQEAEGNMRVENYITRIRSLGNEGQAILLSLVWERIILLNELKKHDIRATQEEIGAYIQALLGVTAGELDAEYRKLLSGSKISDKEFRSQVAENIRIEKLRSLIASSGTVPEIEVRELFDSENTARRIAYGEISSSDVSNVLDIAPKMMDYYHKHKNELKNLKTVSADYLFLKNDSFSTLVKISEDEIRNEYEANKDKYKKDDGQLSELSEVRADIEKELTARKAKVLSEEKAKLIFKLNSAGEMHNAAEQNSLELLSSGYITKETSEIHDIEKTDEFINTALSTEPGKLSRIIDVGNGYVVLSPTEVREEAQSSLSTAAEKIVKALSAEEMNKFIESNMVIIPAMAQAKYILLPRGYYEKDVQVTDEDIKKQYEAYEAFQINAKKEPEPFEKMKETLTRQAKQSKAMEMLATQGRSGLEVSSIEEFEKIPEKFNNTLIIETTEYMLESETSSKPVFNSQMVKRTMFQLEIGSVSKPLLTEQGYVVLTPVKKRSEQVKSLKDILEIVKKANKTEEEKSILKDAGFNDDTYETITANMLKALEERPSDLSKYELYEWYDYFLRQRQIPEEILIPHQRKVIYICVEKENVKDYLDKPFDFEMRMYYDEHKNEFIEANTGKTIGFQEAKSDIEKKLSAKRIEEREKSIKEYYEKHKDEFKKTSDGKDIIPTLDEIRDEIAEKVRDAELDRLTLARAREIRALKGSQLEYQARRQGFVLRESDFFSFDVKTPIDKFLKGEEKIFRSVAFSTELGNVPDFPVRTDKGYCIISPVSERPYEKDKPMAFINCIPAVEKTVKSYMSYQLAYEIAQYMVSEIAKKMEDEKLEFPNAAESVGFKYKETGFFKLTDRELPEFKEEKGLVQAVIGRLAQQNQDSPPLDILPLRSRNIFVYRQIEEKKPANEDFIANKWKYTQRLIPVKNAKTYEEWIRIAAKRANIEPTMEARIEEEARKKQAENQKSPASSPSN